MTTVQDALNNAGPNDLPDRFRQLPIGDVLAGMIPSVNSRTGLVSGTTQVNDIPGAIMAVESPAGTALVIVGPGATPAAGEVAISYDADGLATLEFQAAVTAYDALQQSIPAGLGTTLASDV